MRGHQSAPSDPELELASLPYDPEYKPEYSLLFKATACIVALAYVLALVVAFLTRKKNTLSRPHSSTFRQQQQQQQQQRVQHRHHQQQNCRTQHSRRWQEPHYPRHHDHQQEQRLGDTFAFRDASTATAATAALAGQWGTDYMPAGIHMASTDRPFRKQQQVQLQQPPHQQQQQQQQQQDRPFRFRATDAELEARHDGWAAAGSSSPQQWRHQQHHHQHQQHQQQHQHYATPPRQQLPRQALEDAELFQEQAQEPPSDSDWDPELLARCAANSPYIVSVEGLQKSPAYRSHISKVRGRRLNYETAEAHKLRVYKALRDVDPAGFSQLFTRKDVLEYDDVPPSRLLSTLDCLTDSCLSLALLGAPWLLPQLAPYTAHAAMTWLALHLLLAAAGCTSLVCWLRGVHATYGEYAMLASWPRLVLVALLEAMLVVLTAGLGVLVSLACRLLTVQRQGFGERLLGVVPLREVVRPMRFSPLPPARKSLAAGGIVGSIDFSDSDEE